MSSVYPFSAVVGQARLKHALLLCAVDPTIGGVLVRGPRGVAKTTLARSFAELLPGRFVELPLGATEERVTGTLDLDAALGGRRAQFSPGLLAKAHQGVLYVDEANLLPDALVDLLLDAAASGVNVVERDGVSHTHEARFVLVGTMNPDEGELRPQLQDRFGLVVDADAEIAPPERMQIVTRRLEFDADPERFSARFADAQRALVERCARARQRLSSLALEGPALARVAELCHAAGVEGVRADLAMLRAARAHAALHEHARIELEDVEAVAELALAHRRRAPKPPAPGGAGSAGSGERERAPAPAGGGGFAAPSAAPAGGGGFAAQRAAPAPSGPDGSAVKPRTTTSDRGALPPVPVRAVAPPPLSPALFEAGRRARAPKRSGGGPRQAEPGARVDWFATLLRRPRAASRAELRYRPRPPAPERLWIIALDRSRSMLEGGALAHAKGLAQALAARARSKRAHVGLISFGGRHARVELVARSGAALFERVVARLGAGGGTPLADALKAALALAARPAYARGERAPRLFLLSDGRAREGSELSRRARRALDVHVIDCERSRLRLGRARRIAAALGGAYVHLEALHAATPSGAARAAQSSGRQTWR